MTKLPSIAEELRQAGKKPELKLRPRPELPDDAIEANSKSLGQRYGSSTSLAEGQMGREVPQTAPLTSVRFDCPDYLDKELAVRAAGEGVTKTFLILQALSAAGYKIDPADMIEDRRKNRQKKAVR